LAWDEFYDRYWRLIYAFAKQRGCSDHTAEEIVQEVVLAVFRGREIFRYDPTRGRFCDWLGAVVRNQVVDWRKKPSERLRGRGAASDGGLPEPEADGAPPGAAWQAIFEEELLAALLDIVRGEVHPATYQAFELLELHRLRGKEVAKITGLSRNAAYLARRRVFNRLRELGAPYRDDGRLGEGLKHALRCRPSVQAERSMTERKEKTRRSRQGLDR
jgi:RNA polymerase sigma factor (sigma-70 family)